MTIRFNDVNDSCKTLEVEKHADTVSFFIATTGEEEVGQFIELPNAEIQNLIRYLQTLPMYQ